jgi:hypothetical protein
MIDRQHGGKIFVECDICGAVLETETADFDQARNIMRREGWRARNVCDVWLHGCPKCGAPT